jgi:hypothetical protein
MPAGRPPKFETPELMQEVIDLYFLACRVHKEQALDIGPAEARFNDLTDDQLAIVNDIEDVAPIISGLAYTLGMSTEALRNYEHKDEFVATVKRAKQRVEMGLEQRLAGNAVAGPIFSLKNNFGWKDKTEQDINAKVETKDGTALDTIRMAIEAKSIAD